MMQQYRACVIDLFGLGIIVCGVYIMCTSHPHLASFLFVPALYSTFYFLIYSSPLFLCSVMIVEDILGMCVYACGGSTKEFLLVNY